MKINKLLTKRNFEVMTNKSNKYIVIHYVGATGGAYDNCLYFLTTYRGASAHYFVGHKGEIWQCVEDYNKSWHCGGGLQGKNGHTFYQKCTNSNSIGIEMRCRKDSKGRWYFEKETVDSTIELVKYLMKKYNIPASNVIRHYDVTGKTCPEPYVRNTAEWNKFKSQLTTLNNANTNTVTSDSYKVRINCSALNIRAGAGTKYRINGCIRDRGVYTIVQTQGNWGKLKSGAGWICLTYTKRL